MQAIPWWMRLLSPTNAAFGNAQDKIMEARLAIHAGYVKGAETSAALAELKKTIEAMDIWADKSAVEEQYAQLCAELADGAKSLDAMQTDLDNWDWLLDKCCAGGYDYEVVWVDGTLPDGTHFAGYDIVPDPPLQLDAKTASEFDRQLGGVQGVGGWPALGLAIVIGIFAWPVIAGACLTLIYCVKRICDAYDGTAVVANATSARISGLTPKEVQEYAKGGAGWEPQIGLATLAVVGLAGYALWEWTKARKATSPAV